MDEIKRLSDRIECLEKDIKDLKIDVEKFKTVLEFVENNKNTNTVPTNKKYFNFEGNNYLLPEPIYNFMVDFEDFYSLRDYISNNENYQYKWFAEAGDKTEDIKELKSFYEHLDNSIYKFLTGHNKEDDKIILNFDNYGNSFYKKVKLLIVENLKPYIVFRPTTMF